MSTGLGRLPAQIILPPVGAYLGDASEAASLDQIDGITKVSPAALLHAALQNLLAGANRMGERCAFFDRVGDRLFQVDVFAGGQGIDGHANMPVIRGRDE